MNDLVKFGGNSLPANPEALASGLQNMTQTMPMSGGTPLLRLLKSGVWAFGQEEIEPEQGSEWAVNPYSFQHGWACWGDGELLDEVMVPANQHPPALSELKDHGQHWDSQVSLQLQCLSGEDKGVTVLYKGTSVGMRTAVRELTSAVIAQAAADPNHIVPVIMFDVDHYKHKKYGTVYTPVLDIVRWANIDSGDSAKAEEEAEPEQEPEEKPRRRGRSQQKADEKPAREEEAEPDQESVEDVQDEMEGKPRRRRRRNG